MYSKNDIDEEEVTYCLPLNLRGSYVKIGQDFTQPSLKKSCCFLGVVEIVLD